jgi:hypothetical protein
MEPLSNDKWQPDPDPILDVRLGSTTVLATPKSDFCNTSGSGRRKGMSQMCQQAAQQWAGFLPHNFSRVPRKQGFYDNGIAHDGP